jgi:hypothetical protein
MQRRSRWTEEPVWSVVKEMFPPWLSLGAGVSWGSLWDQGPLLSEGASDVAHALPLLLLPNAEVCRPGNTESLERSECYFVVISS